MRLHALWRFCTPLFRINHVFVHSYMYRPVHPLAEHVDGQGCSDSVSDHLISAAVWGLHSEWITPEEPTSGMTLHSGTFRRFPCQAGFHTNTNHRGELGNLLGELGPCLLHPSVSKIRLLGHHGQVPQQAWPDQTCRRSSFNSFAFCILTIYHKIAETLQHFLDPRITDPCHQPDLHILIDTKSIPQSYTRRNVL